MIPTCACYSPHFVSFYNPTCWSIEFGLVLVNTNLVSLLETRCTLRILFSLIIADQWPWTNPIRAHAYPPVSEPVIGRHLPLMPIEGLHVHMLRGAHGLLPLFTLELYQSYHLLERKPLLLCYY